MPLANYDQDYQQKALQYNVARASKSQLQNRADFQSTRLAIMRGLVDGGSTGAAIGMFPAIYYRSLMPIPRYAGAVAASYAAFLGVASLYRFDV